MLATEARRHRDRSARCKHRRVARRRECGGQRPWRAAGIQATASDRLHSRRSSWACWSAGVAGRRATRSALCFCVSVAAFLTGALEHWSPDLL